jgi:hypothetical protein
MVSPEPTLAGHRTAPTVESAETGLGKELATCD